MPNSSSRPCHVCGNPVPAQAEFCIHCGAKQKPEQKPFLAILLFALAGIVSLVLIFRYTEIGFYLPTLTDLLPSAENTALDETLTPTPIPASPTPQKTKTPQPSPTSTKIPSSTPSPLPSPTPRLAQVSHEIYFIALRKSPGYNHKSESDMVAKIPAGDTVKILSDTPQLVDGLTWWNVSWKEFSGWVAETTKSGKKVLIFAP